MNQSEAFLVFLTNCEFFLLEVAEKTTRTVHAFSIFNQKNENKDESEL